MVRTHLLGAPITMEMVSRGTKLLIGSTGGLVVVFVLGAYLTGSGSPFLFWTFVLGAIVTNGFFGWYLSCWVFHLDPRNLHTLPDTGPLGKSP